MRAFVRSVVTGFAFSMGAALFRKYAPKLGLDEKDKSKDKDKDATEAGGSSASGNAAPDDTAAEPGVGPALSRSADAAIAWIGRTARRAQRQ